jgi:hypothetical protein
MCAFKKDASMVQQNSVLRIFSLDLTPSAPEEETPEC